MYFILWGFLVAVIFVVDYFDNNLGWREKYEEKEWCCGTQRGGQGEGEQVWLREGRNGEESRVEGKEERGKGVLERGKEGGRARVVERGRRGEESRRGREGDEERGQGVLERGKEGGRARVA